MDWERNEPVPPSVSSWESVGEQNGMRDGPKRASFNLSLFESLQD